MEHGGRIGRPGETRLSLLERKAAINTKVFVGNLSFETTPNELQSLFSQVAEVASVVLPTDRTSGRPRGFAFVEFADGEQAAAAVERFDGFELGGRKLRVSEASERRAPTRSPGFGGSFAGADRPRFPRPKGSRRNIRSRKRSIW